MIKDDRDLLALASEASSYSRLPLPEPRSPIQFASLIAAIRSGSFLQQWRLEQFWPVLPFRSDPVLWVVGESGFPERFPSLLAAFQRRLNDPDGVENLAKFTPSGQDDGRAFKFQIELDGTPATPWWFIHSNSLVRHPPSLQGKQSGKHVVSALSDGVMTRQIK